MAEMEYRAWITIPHLAVESGGAECLHDALQKHSGDLGPVLSGLSDGLQVVLAINSDHEADAARAMYDAVTDSLRAAGLADRYPTAIDLEPANDGDLIPA